MNRIDRLFGILLLLQSKRHIRAEDIAGKYEISERTVYRDMSALMQLGVPIISQAGEGYSIVEGYYLPPLIFTIEEAKAVFLGIKMLQSSGNLPEEAEEAITKLNTALPDRLMREIAPLIDKIDFLIEPGKYDLNTPYVVEIQQAIQQQQVLHIRYTGWGNKGTSERQIEPVKLTYGNKTWYIHAYCRLRNNMRSFRINRIENCKSWQKFLIQHIINWKTHQRKQKSKWKLLSLRQLSVRCGKGSIIVLRVNHAKISVISYCTGFMSSLKFVAGSWDGEPRLKSYHRRPCARKLERK